MTKQKWQILLEAKDKITPTVKQAITYVKSLSSKAWRVTLKAVDLVTSPVKRVFGLLKSPLVAAGVTISAGAGIASTVKTYAEFEAAMSQVKAISGATGEEFTQLTEKQSKWVPPRSLQRHRARRPLTTWLWRDGKPQT